MKMRIAVGRDHDVFGYEVWRWAVFIPAQVLAPRMQTRAIVLASGTRPLKKHATALARFVRAELRNQGVR